MARQFGGRERREKTEKFQTFARPKVKVAKTTASGTVFIDYKDTESLKKMISDLNTSRAARKAKGEVVLGTLHMTTDHYVEFTDKDHATIRYYWLTSFVAPEGVASSAPAAQRIPFTGHGIDTLVRVDGKWLIKYRDVNAKD